MIDLQVGNPLFSLLILFSLLAIGLAIFNAVLRKMAIAKFASPSMRRTLLPRMTWVRHALSTILVTASISLLAIALMDIRWGKTSQEVPQKGIEVMFALDVSRSMLAEDVAPNRLQRAKQQIKDMVDEMAGDRIGLVLFAGEAKQAVPLTSHYDDFKQVLDTAGPHSVTRGGSRLGDAIQTAAAGFVSKTNGHQTIVLFTDGEDQESKPVELAKQLSSENNTRIFTVGLGDFETGAKIPNAGSRQSQFVEHSGQAVWSKLNGQVLKAIATESNGAYIPAGTKRVNMADVYHGYVANIQQTEFETAKIDAYVPRYQWFGCVALLILLLETWITTSGGRKKSRQPSNDSVRSVNQSQTDRPAPLTSSRTNGQHSGSHRSVGTAALVLTLMLVNSTHAQESRSVSRQINSANQLLRDQKITEAIDAFNKIEGAPGRQRDQLNYNLAVAHYRHGDFAAAQTLFEQAAQASNSAIAANSRYNLGNCHYSSALESLEQDPKSAIQELQAAIAGYRSSLRLDRNNADARANIELASQLLRQLNQEQQNEQPENEEKKEDDSSEKDQNKDNQEQSPDSKSDSQEPADDQSEESNSEQGDSSPTDPGQEATENEQDANQEQNSSDKNDAPSEKQDPTSPEQQSDSANPQDQPDSSNPQPTEQPQGEQGAKNDEKPEEDSETPAPSESDPDSKDDDESQGKLTSANDADSPAGDRPGTAVARTDKPGQMTRAEALKMLQSIRDRDLLRRFELQKRERLRRVPVEKDW